MNLLKKLFYKPYLLLFLFLGGWLYYFALNNPLSSTLNAILAYVVYILFLRIVFHFIQSPLLKLINLFSIFDNTPNTVLSGYLFILTLLMPLPIIVIALLSAIFIKQKIYDKSYSDQYGNQITQIKSLTPTVILSRKEKGDEEHIVVTKLKKKPEKITYE